MPAPAQNVSSIDSSPVMVPWDRIERFVGQLTHDVRNGLNALELQLTFLGEISTDPEAAEEVKLIRGTLAEVTRQLQTIRQSTGMAAIHKLDYPAAEFFEDLRERFERKEAATKDRMTWTVNVADHCLAIDPEATLSVLLELLTNALRFGEAGCTVTLDASAQTSHIALKIGHPLSQPPSVDFSMWGTTPLLSTHRGAYGLGLFRARRTLEAQGGSLHADFSAPQSLLTTTVTLPLAATP